MGKTYTSKKQPSDFTIDGEMFKIDRTVPGWLFVEFCRTLRKNQAGKFDQEAVVDQGDAIHNMFQSVMTEEEFERFKTFARGPNGPDIETLVEVMGDLAGGDAERPTEPSSS